jgi:hypothetical protein
MRHLLTEMTDQRPATGNPSYGLSSDSFISSIK